MARGKNSFTIDTSDLINGLVEYGNSFDKARNVAMDKAGIQLLTWIINGSPRETRTPPLLTGMLRGSGSAIVRGRVVYTGQRFGYNGNPQGGSNESDSEIKIVFNVPYADKMENGTYNKGKFTAQAPDAGAGFISKHIEKDAKALTRFVAGQVKKQVG